MRKLFTITNKKLFLYNISIIALEFLLFYSYQVILNKNFTTPFSNKNIYFGPIILFGFSCFLFIVLSIFIKKIEISKLFLSSQVIFLVCFILVFSIPAYRGIKMKNSRYNYGTFNFPGARISNLKAFKHLSQKFNDKNNIVLIEYFSSIKDTIINNQKDSVEYTYFMYKKEDVPNQFYISKLRTFRDTITFEYFEINNLDFITKVREETEVNEYYSAPCNRGSW